MLEGETGAESGTLTTAKKQERQVRMRKTMRLFRHHAHSDCVLRACALPFIKIRSGATDHPPHELIVRVRTVERSVLSWFAVPSMLQIEHQVAFEKVLISRS